ncbi:helix-turn-helix domain-containing protein [Streptomyces sp. VRA16 Mangrove soil]|uniref:PucR family transcriptional regulator n=1 Tax=Streptomyces sp. VRA16 Mangrove soil TaxID=2817434 RepID=UPI001A9E1F88|nr:PucR family transcriptional regulator [Streptomyces sp. VRA16 Mangrove soil]MBO1334554.1 helix-turn-helix domain-containing protein [Streptomyces sp. VRA16 Mangrove soil]
MNASGTAGAPGFGGAWVVFPQRLGAELRKENRTLAAEIIHEIRQQIPEFSRPLSGQFGTAIQNGVETALAEFVDRIEEGGGELDAQRLPVYRALGRGELSEGRSLDALQAAYRLGARVAYRRYVRVARRLSLGTEAVAQLAETAFTHIDEIAAASVAAYAQAQADAAGTLGRRRHRLLVLLVTPDPDHATTDDALLQAARDAEWPLPRTVAAAALGPRAPVPRDGAGPTPQGAVSRGLRLPAPVLADLDGPAPCLLVPEPAVQLADPRVRQLLHDRAGTTGPVVPLRQAADSLRWARSLRAHAPGCGPDDADRRLTDLLLLSDPPLVRLMAARRLAPLDALTPKQRDRLAHTLLAHLQTPHGSAPELAERLAIHPQTARQRLHHLQRLFGAQLTDPDARFELEAALRAELA